MKPSRHVWVLLNNCEGSMRTPTGRYLPMSRLREVVEQRGVAVHFDARLRIWLADPTFFTSSFVGHQVRAQHLMEFASQLAYT